MSKILLLEDDELLSETLIDLLESEGFDVSFASNGEEALDMTYNHKFDLWLLDVNVPLIDGFELLKSLRESDDNTPAIFITALSDIKSLSKGFEVGVDDYIKKPFDFDELVVRMNSLIRKSYNSHSNTISIDDFVFAIDKNELLKDDNFIKLSPYELQITKLLFQNLNHSLSKEIILDTLNEGNEMSEGSLRVHINKLRKVGLPIKTLKGIGYRLG